MMAKKEKPAEETPPAAVAAPAAVDAGVDPDAPVKVDQMIPADAVRIVDKQKAVAERPQLFETKNSITANDPIFAPAQGLRAAGSQIEILAFTNYIQQEKALNDKYPSYEELMAYYKQANVQLKGLKPWQVYAYDAEAGTITLMEDPQEKERIEKEWEEKNRL
ncbi:MAG: hypothetical protein JNG89_01820 [Planctomycetaceae bacterium]|nr:hypothetical protein [Planctomycetaceae bacterium]